MKTSQENLQILINAVQMANTKGAYTLQDSKIIAEAVEFFVKPTEPVTGTQTTEEVAKKK